MERIKAVWTGDQAIHNMQRASLVRMVRTLTPMRNAIGQFLSPEQVLHQMLHSLNVANIPVDRAELHELALGVVNVPEKHGFINIIIEHTGESREISLSKIVELAALSGRWRYYTRLIRKWLEIQKQDLGV